MCLFMVVFEGVVFGGLVVYVGFCGVVGVMVGVFVMVIGCFVILWGYFGVFNEGCG